MNCINCGKTLINRQTKYCCQQCQIDYQFNQFIIKWQANEEDGIKGDYQLSNHIRRYMLEKSQHKCEECGWDKINPYTKKIPLEIHHKDGDYTNNSEENLQVLCPNCHSLTENYKNANSKGRQGREKYYNPPKKNFCIDCNKEIGLNAIRCNSCNSLQQRTVERPSREELKVLIREKSFLEIGRMYNISDNAIRKWCITENLPKKKTEIKAYSDEEWALI